MNRSSMTLLLLIAIASTRPVLGQTTLQFRRYYVPTSKVEEFAKDLLPMSRDEFEKRLAAQGQNGESRQLPFEPRITEAYYTARVERDQLIGTDARVYVDAPSTNKSTIVLDPCQLFVDRVEWEEGREPVTVGMNSIGQTVFVVDRSGWLRFNWSRQGKLEASGDAIFDIAFPHCPVSHLTLELPTNSHPVVYTGTLDGTAIQTSEKSDPDSPPSMPQWRIALGGNAKAQFRIVSSSPGNQVTQRRFVRYANTYGLSEAGFDFQTKVIVDLMESPIRKLVMETDKDISIATVRWDGRSLNATELPQALDAKLARYQLDLPEAVAGANHELTVGAVGGTRLGFEWQLPVVRLVDSIWQQERSEVRIPEALSVRELQVSSGNETRITPLPSSTGGNAHEFHFFDELGRIRLQVDRHKNKLNVRSGFSVVVGPTLTSGIAVADLASQYGEHFDATAILPPEWTVDDVTSEPLDVVDSWDVTMVNSQPTIRVAFQRAITSDRPVRIRVNMHRRSTSAINSVAFRLLRWNEIEELDRVVSIRPEPPFQLRATGDLDARSTELGNADDSLDRVSVPIGGLAYRDTDEVTPFVVSLSRDRPTYVADIATEVGAGGGRLTLDYSIRCEPQGSAVSRIYVFFSEPETGSYFWSGEKKVDILTSRKLDVEEGRRIGFGTGEIWEINLRQPQSVPFTIHARRTSSFTEQAKVPLASVPQANRQNGRIFVRATDGSRPKVNSLGLVHAIAMPLENDAVSLLRASFHHEPSQHADLTLQPEFAPASLPISAILTRAVSQVEPDGRSVHTILYRLENAGHPRLRVRLPNAATFSRIAVNNVEQERGRIDGQSEVTIVLPTDMRFPLVQVVYTSRCADLEHLREIEFPLPEVDVPSLAIVHDVWLPPSYVPHAPDEGRILRGSRLGNRFFGPLFRSSRSKPFEFLNLEEWRVALGRPTRRHDVAEDFIAYLANKTVSDSPIIVNNRNWGDLFRDAYQHVQDSFGQRPQRILVDSMSLAEVGIHPSTIAFQPNDGSSVYRGHEALRRAGLALIVHPDAWCITSRSTARLLSADLEGSRLDDVWHTLPGTTADDIARAAALPSLTWIDAINWSTGTHTLSNWPALENTSILDLPTHGWRGLRNVSRSAGSHPATTRVIVHHDGVSNAMGWAICLVIAGALSRVFYRRPHLLLVLMPIASLVVLLASPAWLAVARGLFYGLLLGKAVALFGIRWSKDAPLVGSKRLLPMSTISLAGSAGLLLLAIVFTRFVAGQETTPPSPKPAASNPPTTSNPMPTSSPATSSPASSSPASSNPATSTPTTTSTTYPVIIPVDADGKPTGAYLYAPLPLYEALLRREVASKLSMAWLIHSASYLGNVEAESRTGRLGLTRWESKFDFEVLTPGAPIRFPIGKSGDTFITAIVDGQSVRAEFNEKTGEVSIADLSVGHHIASITMRPATTSEGMQQRADFTIPKIPNSRVEVTTPRSATSGVRIEANAATWFAPTAPDQPFVVELGSTDSFTLIWPTELRAGTAEGLVVDELLWLRVFPDSVVVDAKFVLNPLNGSIREFIVDTDFGLRLVPNDDNNATLRRQFSQDSLQRWEWEFAQPVRNETAFRCSFAINATSGLGHVRLPQITVRNARIARRWVAVTLPSDLVMQPSTNIDMVTPADFRSVWGGMTDLPQFAFRNPNQTSWTFHCRTRSTKSISRQDVDFRVLGDVAELEVTAKCDSFQGSTIQSHFIGCEGLDVVGVYQIAGNSISELHWTKLDDRVAVFFDKSPSPEYALKMVARSAINFGKDLKIPKVQLDGTEIVKESLSLYRRPDVIVQLAGGKPPDRTDNQAESSLPLVGIWTLNGAQVDSDRPTIIVDRNRADARGQLKTALTQKDDRWWCDATCDLEIEHGVIDVVRFELPDSLREPIELRPEMPYRVRVSGSKRRELVVRLPQRADKKFHLQLHAEVQANPGERFAAPLVSLLDLNVVHLHQLPSSLDGNPINWETFGLRETSSELYQAIDSRPTATLNISSQTREAPRLSLVDGVLNVDERGDAQGAISFTLEPAGSTDCSLQVPETVDLLDVMIDGIPAQQEKVSDRIVRIALGGTTLPQRVIVAFRGRPISGESGGKRFELPTILGIEVDRTMWTVQEPRGWPLPDIPEFANELSIARAQLLRYGTANRLLARVGSETRDEDLQAWRKSWERSIENIRYDLKAISRMSESVDDRDELLAAIGSLGDDGKFRRSDWDPVSIAESAGRVKCQVLTWEIEGNTTSILIPEKWDHERATWPWLRTVTIVILFVGFAWLAVKRPVVDWFANRPELTAALIGLFWWIFLTPSVVGVVILLACLLFRTNKLLAPALGKWRELRNRMESVNG